MKLLIYISIFVIFLYSCDKDGDESELVVETTEVYNDIAPIIWTELDLSKIVGQNYAFVTFKITNLSTESEKLTEFIFRQKGDNDEYYDGSSFSDNVIVLLNNGIGQISSYTDEKGMVEWKAQHSLKVKIEIIAFIK